MCTYRQRQITKTLFLHRCVKYLQNVVYILNELIFTDQIGTLAFNSNEMGTKILSSHSVNTCTESYLKFLPTIKIF